MKRLVKTRLAALRNEIYELMVACLNQNNKCLLTCVTGLGKTVAFQRYMREHKEEKILYVTDRKAAIGFMTDYMQKYNPDSTAVTYAFLSRNEKFDAKLEYISQFDTLVFDEAHLMGAHNCEKIVELVEKNNMKLLGGTATPLRMDGLDVAVVLFDGHVVEYSMRQAVDDGFLLLPHTNTTVFLGLRVKKLQETLSGKSGNKSLVSMLNGMERAIAGRDTIKDSILEAVDISGTGIWIVFHPNIKALNIMRPIIDKVFTDAFKNVQTFAVSSGKDFDGEPHLDVKQFKSLHGGFSVVHAVDMMTTGWHFDDISGLILNSLTDSPVKATQQLGRAIELGTGRVTSIIDIAGRFSREKNTVIESIELIGAGEGRNRSRSASKYGQYDVDAVSKNIEFDAILTAIEEWANLDYRRMTPEQAMYYIRKIGYRLCDASRVCGLPENVLSKMLETSDGFENIMAG